ncbi:hypothetical protein, partial [Gardnerella vaginalis]|uniref:hypothetical protein n=2 Tax=Gardnerella vaginalis TaxID=2702 RepID=UPI0002633DFB
PNKHHKTIENKPKHRRVENTQKTTTNHHNHQHKTKNNPKNKQKTIKNPKPGSVENKIDGQLTHNCPSIQSLSILYLSFTYFYLRYFLVILTIF